MKIVRAQDAADEIATLQKHKIVVFAGSGVSIWEPTTLPSGASVTNSIWEALLTGIPLSSEESSLLLKLASDFPFEHLFEICPNQPKARDFLIGLYDCRVANPVHSLLAKATEGGLVSSIITTNYDHCFEAAFSSHPHITLQIIADERDAHSLEPKRGGPFLFKVHGTAETGSESLIFNLRGEGLLPIGKRTLLTDLMSNAHCLFVGYSGLDFDLCPLISQFEGARVFWIGRESEPRTANAKSLLSQVNGTYISGDMLDILANWAGMKCVANLAKNQITPNDIKNVFSEEELSIWRISLFNSLGFPKFALRVLASEKLQIPETARLLQTSRSLFYAGKYRQASESYASLARLHSRAGDTKTASDVWLDTSDSFRAGGFFLRAWISLLKGKRAASDFDKSKFYLKKSLLISNLLEGLDALNAPQFIRLIVRSRLRQNLNTCLRLAIEQGSLHDFQQVGFLAEKHTVDLDSVGFFKPKLSREGYNHLGYYHAEIMTFTESQRRRDFSTLSAGELGDISRQIDEYVCHCEITGQDSSMWKLLAIKRRLLTTHGMSFDGESKLLKCLESCQYSIVMRKSQMSRFGLPS